MSQTARQNPASKHAPTSEPKRQETPITDLSPNDPIGVDGGGGDSKPATPMK